jgi:translation initiation factor IF-3
LEILTRAKARSIKEVRLVGAAETKIVTMEEVFREAEDKGLDVVCVSDQTVPVVVRLQDFKKLEYEKAKQRKLQKAKNRTSELKEIQLKVNISDHDLETKTNNIRKFLDRGDKVKIMVRLKGRERESPQRAQALIDRVAGSVTCRVSRLPGPMTMAILEPEKKVEK